MRGNLEKASWMLIISVLLFAEIHSIRWDKTHTDDKARSDRTAQDAAFELVLKKEDAQLQETLRGFDTVGRLARKSIENQTGGDSCKKEIPAVICWGASTQGMQCVYIKKGELQ
jgi:hypothetical protein